MFIRSKAPLRLGLAGGGTDVSPYSDIYGGAILNATINMYSYTTIQPMDNGKIIMEEMDLGRKTEMPSSDALEINGEFSLIKGVYNRIVRDFVKKPLSFHISTYVDAPPGSGLGTSSTLTVSILGAFCEWLKLPLGDYDIAHLAFQIERQDLGMSGGKQDQYAATFGGFNFMEFYADDKVIVNPLRIRQHYISEMDWNFVLYYTGISRVSSNIIQEQQKNVQEKKEGSVAAMHKVKEQALLMKEAILKGNFGEIGKILDFGWQYKKQMAKQISNSIIDEIYEKAIAAGSTGGKLSGAGGGGFMTFYCPGNSRFAVIQTLKQYPGQVHSFEFVKHGLMTWQQS
ncbi:MAG: dehydrogenase [Candidatus Brocadiae bacterium]|nr:dehydrogenase [Candidatus Brocadiia bacterium]